MNENLYFCGGVVVDFAHFNLAFFIGPQDGVDDALRRRAKGDFGDDERLVVI